MSAYIDFQGLNPNISLGQLEEAELSLFETPDPVIINKILQKKIKLKNVYYISEEEIQDGSIIKAYPKPKKLSGWSQEVFDWLVYENYKDMRDFIGDNYTRQTKRYYIYCSLKNLINNNIVEMKVIDINNKNKYAGNLFRLVNPREPK